MNLACVGRPPLGLVNCLNFGNPEHPEVMWQLSEAIDGMAEACRALSVPVVGGNVSLYNESERDQHRSVARWSARSGWSTRSTGARPASPCVAGTTLVLLGAPATRLSGSAWAWAQGHKRGTPPTVDLDAHRWSPTSSASMVVAGGCFRSTIWPAASALRSPRWPRAPASAPPSTCPASRAATSPSSPRRRRRCCAPSTPTTVAAFLDAAPSGGRAGRMVGRGRWHPPPHRRLVDIAVDDLHRSWRDALPDALGGGTVQASRRADRQVRLRLLDGCGERGEEHLVEDEELRHPEHAERADVGGAEISVVAPPARRPTPR